MSDFDNTTGDRVIRISHDDAASDHVNDLLQRQRAMRGERGMTRSPEKHWYYRNWLIFMLVGTIGAVLAWAIVEPYYDDMPYVQAKIESISSPAELLGGAAEEIDAEEIFAGVTIELSDCTLLVPARVYVLPSREKVPVASLNLQVGQEIGVHVHQEELEGGPPLLFAAFIDPAPPPAKAGRRSGSLKDANSQTMIMGMLLFPLVAGMVGLLLGATDGLICRLLRRALLCGFVGLLAGLLGGLVSMIVANLAYAPITMMAEKHAGNAVGGLNTYGFLIQMGGRGLAWLLAGMAMGLGQGIALRSRRLLVYGFLGGIVGGLFGGLLFDPIHFLIAGEDAHSGHLSRLVSLAIIGATVGLMIGVVELLARDSWLQMIQGPLAGKEFLIFKDLLYVGASPRSDIFVFNDPEVAPSHAVIRQQGEDTELESLDSDRPATINGRPVKRQKLRHGDKVAVGKTIFVYQTRQG